MEVIFLKVKPVRGKFTSRKKAKVIRELLLTSKKPDHTALKKEADEFIDYIKSMRSVQKL